MLERCAPGNLVERELDRARSARAGGASTVSRLGLSTIIYKTGCRRRAAWAVAVRVAMGTWESLTRWLAEGPWENTGRSESVESWW